MSAAGEDVPQVLHPVEGLAAWLAQVGLEDRLAEVVRWCDEQGACFLEEVAEHSEVLCEALKLDAAATARVVAAARPALRATLPRGGSTTTGDEGHASSEGGGLSLRAVSAATFYSCDSTGSVESAGSHPPRPAPRSTSGSLSRVLTITVAAQNFRRLSHRARSTRSDDTPASLAPVSESAAASPGEGLQRTATCTVDGPLARLISAIPIKDKTLSISEVSRSHAHGDAASVASDGDDKGGMTPMSLQAKEERASARLQRRDTCGLNVGAEGGNRDGLMDRVQIGKPVNLDHGQTGLVYALEVGGEKVAVFKPLEGEKFGRRSLDAGKGSVREEAVYLVDRLSGSVVGVPVTSRATIHIDGAMHYGSVQAFIGDSIGFVEDYCMPRDLERACEFVPQATVEAVAFLDLRVMNMDRHSANLLLTRREKPHGLGVIDHGCCLPPWWSLSEAIFDAWLEWAQVQQPPCDATKRLAQTSVQRLADTCEKLHGIGLESSGILTLRLCTNFAAVGIEQGVSLAGLAHLALRDEETGFEEYSWLETQVMEQAIAAGARCETQRTARGEQMMVVEKEGEGLNEAAFLAGLDAVFRRDLRAAAEARARPGAPWVAVPADAPPAAGASTTIRF